MPSPLSRFIIGGALSAFVACPVFAEDDHGKPASGYHKTNLVADRPGIAVSTDPNLVNPWGVAFFPGGAFWINDNGTGLATLYDGQGNIIPATFTVPAPPGQAGHSAPTGEVINVTRGFLVPGTSLPAAFVFSTEDGTISAWAGGLTTNPTSAVLAADNSASGAVYKGLAFGTTASGNFLYATNFHSGAIDVFDSTFQPTGAKILGNFQDKAIPPGYAPFGISNISGNLFVTYAKQDADKHDDLRGPGHGYVDVFDTEGRLLQHFAQGGLLNSPWAVALAPAGFGKLSNTVLIGNFGSGAINAYDLRGKFQEQLEDRNGRPITISGLWGLYFGGAAAAAPDTLFFTAGSDHEAHGLFGSIAPN